MAVPRRGSRQGRWALKAFPLPHRRERSKVPYIVRQCVEEIERRGMEEVGIYRVSGVATDIQALKAAFDVSEYQPRELRDRDVGEVVTLRVPSVAGACYITFYTFSSLIILSYFK